MPIPPVEHLVLPNGIELISLNSSDIDGITRITLSWKGGIFDAASSPAAKIATQLSKCAGKNFPADIAADLFDFNGGWLRASLVEHNNSLTLFSLNRTLDTLLSAFVDIVNSPTYPVDEMEVIKEQVASERATALKKVTTHAEELDTFLTFGATHPATRTYTPEQIRDIDIETIIAAGRRLRANQAPIAFVVGDLTPDVMVTITTKLSQIECQPTGKGYVNIIPAQNSQSTRLHKEIPASLQSAIRLSIPTVDRAHPDYQNIRLMTTALGGYFGSRLMMNIRERKGLTYGIGASVYGYHEGAFITINSQCDNRYVEQVIAEINHEIEELATNPMNRDELNAVKQVATASLLSLFDSPFSIMDYYITLHHINIDIDYFKRQQEAIMALTPQVIRDTAREYLSHQNLLISTAGIMCS